MDRLSVIANPRPSLASVTLKQQAKLFRSDGREEKKRKTIVDHKPFCSQYASHGYCDNGRLCERTHDLDLILDFELTGKVADPPTKKPKLDDPEQIKLATEETTMIATTTTTITEIAQPSPPALPETSSIFETYHSACFDAFMTGFVFCHQLEKHPTLLQDHGNKIYLIGKSRPLLVKQSSFARMSDGHLQRKKVAMV
ncbi:Target of EGR1, member 1 (Nuclear) [Dinochytrium kinnereticum]|nr:Target of EGR1, member 1 (Nuclear) [Dinochytrium kinnereticum]